MSYGEYGIWEVRGADTNYDLGGYHSQPFLGYYEGRYEDVLAYAQTELKGWQGWGPHDVGSIKKVHVTKIDADFHARQAKIKELEKKKQELQEQIETLAKNESKREPLTADKCKVPHEGPWQYEKEKPR